jgi:prepilin-type N-terminal cleavage/methylation domain-containing protein
MSIDRQYRQRGFSLLETLIVIAIVLILSAIGMPKMMRIIDQEKLRTSAQDYASFLQLSRERAIQDDQFYQVQWTLIGGNKPIVYLDLNGNGSLDTGEPQIQLPAPVVITDTSAPTPTTDFPTLLGTTPLTSSTTDPPAMTAYDGTQRAGLAFNGRGLPCQRYSVSNACMVTMPDPLDTTKTVIVAWVTYLRYSYTGGGTGWAAISVTPAGRIKSWSYNPSGTGSWQ